MRNISLFVTVSAFLFSQPVRIVLDANYLKKTKRIVIITNFPFAEIAFGRREFYAVRSDEIKEKLSNCR